PHRRNWTCSGGWRSTRGRWKRRLRHTSRTESLFIYMISPVNFMRYGRGGGICPIYASLSIKMQKSRRRDWRWFRASSRFWRRGWPFWALTPRPRCGSLFTGVTALTNGGLWGHLAGANSLVLAGWRFRRGMHHHDG